MGAARINHSAETAAERNHSSQPLWSITSPCEFCPKDFGDLEIKVCGKANEEVIQFLPDVVEGLDAVRKKKLNRATFSHSLRY